MFMSVISLISAISSTLIVGADIVHSTDEEVAPSSYTVNPSESGRNPLPSSQSVPESSTSPLTSFLSKATTGTSNSPSSPISKSAEFDTGNAATPSETKPDDSMIANPDLINSENPSKTTTSPHTTLSIANPCDNDQLVVSDKPSLLNANTNSTNCNVLINAENSTAISVTLLKSDINNVYTYFYIEILDNSTQMCPERYLLVTGSHTPCKVLISGNQFRFHFQNTEMMLEIHTEDVELSTCYDTQFPLVGFERCNVTSYESEIQWHEEKQVFEYGHWNFDGDYEITVNLVQYQAMCACDCPYTCMCTLGYREWLSKCIADGEGSDTNKRDLIVYSPSIQGLSFAKSGIHVIQQNTFLGLESLKVLNLSHNILTTLPPTVCQNLPQLKILRVDNNRLANLTSDLLKGQCEQQLLRLDLSNNDLINFPNDLFNKTNKMRTLELRQNRLIQLFNDSFTSLTELEILYLNDNKLSLLPHGVFASLGELRILDLRGNAICILPQDVFASLGNLDYLDLSGNAIHTIPQGVFASLVDLDYLVLRGNAIHTLPQDVFASLGVLSRLYLSDNAIHTLPQDVFASLGELLNLDLSGNAIHTYELFPTKQHPNQHICAAIAKAVNWSHFSLITKLSC